MESLVQALDDAMTSGPGFPWWLAWAAMVTLFVGAIHEGGHLLAAIWTGQEQMAVRVGSWGGLIEQRLGAVRLSVSLVPLPWRTAGAVSFDAALTTVRQMLFIALAGPAASLAGAVVTALLAASVHSDTASGFFAAATFFGVFTGFFNLIPMTYTEGTRRKPGTRVMSDGRHALNALRVLSDLRR